MRPGRNQPCRCGSGKKFKHCCGRVASAPLDAPPAAVPAEAAPALCTERLGEIAPQALRTAAEPLPHDAAAHNNFANALARLGRLDEAISSYRRAVTINPRMPEAHNNLAHALLDLGRPDDALLSCRRALELRPEFPDAHDNLGSAEFALGLHVEALASFRRAIAVDPKFAEAHNNLGNALAELGRIEEALESFRQAIEINSKFAEAHSNLGNGLRALGRLPEAVASYRRALNLAPDFAAAHCNLGIAYRLQGKTVEAQKACRRALAIDPQLTAAAAALAEASADQGEFAESEALLKQAIALQPESTEAWAGLVRLRKMTRDDAPWLTQAQRLLAQGLPAQKEISLRYAIGKYFDDIGDFEQAFDNFRRANQLSLLRRPPHDREHLTLLVDQTIRTFDDRWIRRPRSHATDSALPVFIVGMLRSGTSLAEQILASHPAVFGAGELTFWNHAAAAHGSSRAQDAHETLLREQTCDYLRLLREIAPDALRVIDKMPTNFAYLGLINAALPNARIIHMQRDPLDTCLSIYTQHFEAGVSYANDLQDIAHYYREYRRLMQHWRQALPGNVMLEVPYEALVAEQIYWSRRMVEFIGLPWDARCVDFHRTQRAVLTASKWQVRQNIHGSSVHRWRNYETFIAPLRELAALD